MGEVIWEDESVTGPRIVPPNAESFRVPTDPKVDEKIFEMSLTLLPGVQYIDTEKVRDRFDRLVPHLAEQKEALFAGFGDELKMADLQTLKQRF